MMQLTNKHTVGSCYSACEVLSKQSNKHLKPPEHKDKNTDVVSTEEQYSLLLDMHSSLFLSLSLSHTHISPAPSARTWLPCIKLNLIFPIFNFQCPSRTFPQHRPFASSFLPSSTALLAALSPSGA